MELKARVSCKIMTMTATATVAVCQLEVACTRLLILKQSGAIDRGAGQACAQCLGQSWYRKVKKPLGIAGVILGGMNVAARRSNPFNACSGSLDPNFLCVCLKLTVFSLAQGVIAILLPPPKPEDERTQLTWFLRLVLLLPYGI